VKIAASEIFHCHLMETALGAGHASSMVKRRYQRTFIREWRKYRKLTLEQLAGLVDMSPSHLSMLERSERGYTQETMEAIATALKTDVASLLTRSPTDPEGIYAVWEQAKPAQRRQIIEVARTLLRTA